MKKQTDEHASNDELTNEQKIRINRYLAGREEGIALGRQQEREIQEVEQEICRIRGYKECFADVEKVIDEIFKPLPQILEIEKLKTRLAKLRKEKS